MSEPTTNPTGRATSGPDSATDGPTDGADLRVGDRITVLPGKAISAHTRAALARGFALDVTSLQPDFDGSIEVTGVVLTSRGAWRADAPTRSVILTSGAYATPIRVADTVAYPATGETPVVTAVHERFDGTAVADLLFGRGDTETGVNLLDLTHLKRPAALPAVQACKRRHDPQRRCRRCIDARQPVITPCEGPLCRQVAEDLVVFRPPARVAIVRALCPTHRDELTTRENSCRTEDTTIEVHPLTEGTHAYGMHGDGTEIATCQHCGHAIYLYPALRGHREPWREGVYDETGRCGPAEDRHRIRMLHEPAVTVAERDYARAAASCGTAADLHPLAECPARQA